MFILLLIAIVALAGIVGAVRNLGTDGYRRVPVRESGLVSLRH